VYYEIGNSTTEYFAANVSNTSYTHTGLQPNTTFVFGCTTHGLKLTYDFAPEEKHAILPDFFGSLL
jgi:hypothetical protein